jgi:hypothetical protein
LRQQDFEGSFPPAGWTVVDHVAGGTWQDNATRGVPNYTAAGSGNCAVAHAWSDNSVFWDTELRSPSIKIPSGCTYMLTYASMFQDYAGNGEIWVGISTDTGATWTNLRNQSTDDPPGGSPAVGGTSEMENLSAYAGKTVIIRWRYKASNSPAWCWHIDSVEIRR